MSRTVPSTRVGVVRTTLLLLALVAGLTACAGGDDGDGADETSGVDAVERTTTERAKEAIPLASGALAATATEIYTQWQSCMAISWKHAVFGFITAPEGNPARQLESIRTALLDAGYDDATQVDGHVTMSRDETTFDIQQPGAAYGKGTWQVSVTSACAGYRGDDKARIDNDTPTLVEGFGP